MDPVTAASTAMTAYKTGKEICGSVKELMDKLDDFRDQNVISLTAYTKRTLITSRVYVADQLASEDITPKLLGMLNTMYSGFVLTALGLNNLVIGGRNVRQMTAPIATEAFHDSFADLVKTRFAGEIALEDNSNQDGEKKDKKTWDKMNQAEKKEANDKAVGDLSVNQKKLEDDSKALFTGRLLEAKIPTKMENGKIETFPLYFYVQLLPTVIPGATMAEFLRANVSPPTKLRWAMWKAGEISFWKDFVFECDRVAKRKKALKVDKDGFLREMEDRRAQLLKQKMANYKNKDAEARRRNICNSIVIVTKRTIDGVCRDNGINLKSFTQRQELMQDTFAVMLAVVDTNYGTIDLYMNGIEGRGEYTAKMIDAASKKKDAFDVKELLTLISAGSMPTRF